MTTHSSATRQRVKTTPSSLAGLQTCLGKIFSAFASSVSPPSSEFRTSLSRRNFYVRKEREWAPEALCRMWNYCLCVTYLPTHLRYWYLFMQKQANGTSATLPSTPSVCSARVNADGRRNYWALATILQVSFRRSRAIPSGSAQIPTCPHGGCNDDRRLFDTTN